jgi:hypothetical protein
MTGILKGTAIAALIGAAALASVTPSEARNRWIGPAAAGLAVGAIVGSAATGAYAYGPRYYEPGYAYAPAYSGYAYEAAPAYDAYAYEAAPVYVAPRYYRGRSGSNGCSTQGNYGQSVDESACNR